MSTITSGYLDYEQSLFFIPHLFERLFLISWENDRDCYITMPLSLKTMEVQGTSEIRGLERCRSTVFFLSPSSETQERRK